MVRGWRCNQTSCLLFMRLLPILPGPFSYGCSTDMTAHPVFRPITLLGLLAANAQAIDLQPGDIRAPRPGLSAIQLTLQHSDWGDRYVDGKRQPGSPEIATQTYQMRVGHAYELVGHPAYSYLQLSSGYVHPEGTLSNLEGDSGLSDLGFATALWPYANHETKTYLGIAAYLMAPTGSYDAQRKFNIGQNRYQAALQVGVQKETLPDTHWMAAADGLYFGTNTDYGANHADLEQRMLYSLQTGLRYDFSPTYALAGTYFYSKGGETLVNDRARDDAIETHRYQITGIANLSFGRLTLQYGGDLETRNGFMENDRFIMRYTMVF